MLDKVEKRKLPEGSRPNGLIPIDDEKEMKLAGERMNADPQASANRILDHYFGALVLLDRGTEEEARPGGGGAPEAKRLLQAVKDLGNNDSIVRQNAEEILLNAGAAALPFLRDAIKSEDREVQKRASRIVENRIRQYRNEVPYARAEQDWKKERENGSDDMEMFVRLGRLKDVDDKTARARLQEIANLRALNPKLDASLNPKPFDLQALNAHEDDYKELKNRKAAIETITRDVKTLSASDESSDSSLAAAVSLHPNLETLSLSTSKITDAGLKLVGKLKKLEGLFLNDTNITDKGLKNIGHMQSLERLFLDQMPVTDAGLEHIKNLTNLQELRLSTTAITDKGMEKITNFVKLKLLDLSSTAITDKGLSSLKDLRRMENLDVSGTKITDSGLKHLAGWKELSILDASQTPLTDKGVSELAKLTELRRLYLADTAITDAAVKDLVKLKNLGTLNVSGTKISAEGIAALRKALPDTTVIGTAADDN